MSILTAPIEEVASRATSGTPDVAAWQPGDDVPGIGAVLYHPLANLFPLIGGREFSDLVDDIRANGQREAIVLDRELPAGRILDGRNRYKACIFAGVEPRFEALPDGADPLAYVISRNLRRRHLTEGQRALIAAKLATMPQGARTDLSPIGERSQAEAAQLLKVSKRSVERAREVVESGTEALQRTVEAGIASIAAAAVIAAQPAARQDEILAQLPRDAEGQLTPEAKAAVRKAAGELRAEGTADKQAKRAERERSLAARQAALPERRYGVIYADPEWRFEPYSRATGMDRAADNHYPTSELEAIAARPVAEIAAPDCVLFLWATVPMLPEALRVMQAWGFRYRSHVVWRKAEQGGRVVLGTGYWFRNGHELLLVGTRGDVVAPAMGMQFPSIVDAPPMKHSQKPERFAEMIEAYFPTLPKIELNRRGPPRSGWDAWGYEAEAAA